MNTDANLKATVDTLSALATIETSHAACVKILEQRVAETLSMLSQLSPEDKQRVAELVVKTTRYITPFGNPDVKLGITALIVEVSADHYISESFNKSIFVARSDPKQSGLMSIENFVDLTDLDATKGKVTTFLNELTELQSRIHDVQVAASL